MYPNLYYVFKDWFGVEWRSLQVANTFGIMVAFGFITAAYFLYRELRRKEQQGLLHPREEMITVGKPAGIVELLVNAFVGFLFGYKLLGLFLSRPEDMPAQKYIFSTAGSLVGGILLALVMAGLKYWEKNKNKLDKPEQRNVRIWPHDRVGDIIIIGLVGGIVGAKLFDALENWDALVKHPVETLFSGEGLTFYGGLIVAAILIIYFGAKKGIRTIHLMDAAAPALLITYAVGRIGCQVAGDGDWGVYNASYVNDSKGKVILAQPGDYRRVLDSIPDYFMEGHIPGTGRYNGRTTDSLSHVPHISFKAPSFVPTWMVAYNYPKNVNADGVLIPGDTDEHNRVLPLPVFPTPFYETVLCLLLFMILWSIRKKIRLPGMIFGIYLVMNGLERFTVEKIRVNTTYSMFGFHPTQAEIISVLLFLTGIGFIFYARSRKYKD